MLPDALLASPDSQLFHLKDGAGLREEPLD